jgi:hypothetical protein
METKSDNIIHSGNPCPCRAMQDWLLFQLAFSICCQWKERKNPARNVQPKVANPPETIWAIMWLEYKYSRGRHGSVILRGRLHVYESVNKLLDDSMHDLRDWGQRMDGRKNAEYQNLRITKPPETWIAPICNFGSILNLQLWIYSEAFLNHISARKDMYMPFFWLYMQLWIYSEAILKHFSITSLHRRTCTCLYFNYAALDLFWSISEALFNHISAMYMPFYKLCSFWSILKHFWSTFQSYLCKEGHVLLAETWLKSASEMLQNRSKVV